MDEQPEVIHQQMEETRAALVEKLEALEGQVAETVQSTTHAVQDTTTAVTDTVESVKETVENVSEQVQETVTNVKDTVQHAMASVAEAFDLGLQTERHPWLVVGGAVAVGYLGACLLNNFSNRAAGSGATSREALWRPPSGPAPAPRLQAEAPTNGKRSGFALPGWLSEELGRLRGLAVGAVMGVVRDLARQGIPGALGERLADEVEVVNSKLGGERVPGPLVPAASGGESHAG
jgi:ElaB/YqjD/DUF883 family membrane-anchored ribosome-binding protein